MFDRAFEHYNYKCFLVMLIYGTLRHLVMLVLEIEVSVHTQHYYMFFYYDNSKSPTLILICS